MNSPPKKKTPATAAVRNQRPAAAPPVYRPCPTPVVLQRKTTLPGRLPHATPPDARRTPVAPPVYRPQSVPKVMQAKVAVVQPRSSSGTRVSTQIKISAPSVRAFTPLVPVNQKWPGVSRTIQRAAEEEFKPAEASEQAIAELVAADLAEVEAPPPPGGAAAMPAHDEKKDRKTKASEEMVWSDATLISKPSRKHILEELTAGDITATTKVSVVRLTVAEAARSAIQAHVKANGWKSGPGIKIEWVDADSCYKITYLGNE